MVLASPKHLVLTCWIQTAAAITAQTPVVVENLSKLLETGEVGKAVYDGYTSCPLFTGYGSVSTWVHGWRIALRSSGMAGLGNVENGAVAVCGHLRDRGDRAAFRCRRQSDRSLLASTT